MDNYYFIYEKEMLEFRATTHTLKEWMDFGFNKLYIPNNNGGTEIYIPECGLTEELKQLKAENATYKVCEEWEYDSDGYLVLKLKKVY